MPRVYMGAEAYARMQGEHLHSQWSDQMARAMAASRPPREWQYTESLTVYACGHGMDVIVVPFNDKRVAGNRSTRRIVAFYKE